MKTKFYDIHDYIYIPFWKTNTFIYIMVVLFLALFSVSAYFLFMYWKKKNAEKKRLTHWDWAFLELKKFTPETYESKEEFKQFYFAITKIMKRYLEKMFHLDVLEKTDEELVKHLRNETARIDSDFVENLEKVLQGSLFIKFANAQALQEQAKKDLEMISDLIKKTIPSDATSS